MDRTGAPSVGSLCPSDARFSGAVQHFHLSAQAFRELGQSAEVTRTEWGFALVVLSSGRLAEAIRLLRTVLAAFHDRQMVTEEALVVLDMMDAHHALNHTREILGLASETIQIFTDAGMLTSALTAFAYLKDSARAGTVTTQQIEHVRSFMHSLEGNPKLLFLPLGHNFL